MQKNISSIITNPIQQLGASFCSSIAIIGSFTIFTLDVFISCFSRPWYYKELGLQLFNVGFLSIPIVSLTAFFSGAVLALQSYNSFAHKFNIEGTVPIVVAFSIVRELGPVLSALMITSRVGSSITAELSTMKISEQIDVLCVLKVDPIKYLIVPRVLAAIISVTSLILIVDVIGILGGYIISVNRLGLNGYQYIQETINVLDMADIYLGLTKSAVFGAIIGLVSCFFGYNCKIGSKGVSEATIKSVVISCISILLTNYFVTEIFVKVM